jgi:hypothetical protein
MVACTYGHYLYERAGFRLTVGRAACEPANELAVNGQPK